MKKLLGFKKGMTQIFDETGNVVPVSVIEAGPCFVTQIKTEEKDGYNAIQIGFGATKKANKPAKGHLGEISAKHLREIRVDKPEDFKVGQEIKVEMFQPGEAIEISGVSIGKGFQGNIKRHHHHRGPMSHGSKSHRITGSIGAGTTPGRVLKGQAMPGRMGGVNVTVDGLKVVRVDAGNNLLLVKGSVPGKPGNLVMISAEGEFPKKVEEKTNA
ncbi:MAG: 50S ribosomal protein L3 [bacterium]